MFSTPHYSITEFFRCAICLGSCVAVVFVSDLAPRVWGQVDSQDFVAGTSARDALPTERTLDYDFESISVAAIERWLSWVNVKLPVDAEGEVSGWLWVQRSSRGLFDFREYWLEGEITSPALTVDGWLIREARLRFGYRSGAWYVGRLKGDVMPPEQIRQAGRVELAARLPVDSPALLNLSGTISKVDLASLLRGLEVDLPVKNGGGELTFNARVPIDRSNDLKYWTGDANLRLNEVLVAPLRDPVFVTANAGLQDGQWRVRDSRFVLQSVEGADIPLRIAANGPLESPWPFSINASSSNVALHELLRQFGLQAWADDIQGLAAVTATAGGDAVSGINVAKVNIGTNELIVQQQPLGGVSLVGNLMNQAVNLQLRAASFAGGTLIVNADWMDLRRTQQGKPNRISASLAGVRLEAVKWPWLANRFAGTATGRVTFETQGSIQGVNRERNLEDKTAWGSEGELAIVDSYFEGTSLGNVELNWSKASDQSTASGTLQLVAEAGQAAANVAVEFMDDPASSYSGDRLGTYRASGSLDNFTASIPAAYFRQADVKQADVAHTALGSGPTMVRATGRFDIAGSREDWFETGSAELDSLDTQFAGRDVQLTGAIVEATPEELRLRQFTLRELTDRDAGRGAARRSSGRILGAGIMRRDGTGEHLLRLAINDVAISPYWNWFAPEAYVGFAGRISSVIQLTVPANEQREFNLSNLPAHEVKGKISGSVRGLSFRDETIGDFDFRGEVDDGQLQASAEGDVLDGRAEISIEVSDALQQFLPRKEVRPLESRIDARLEAVQLEKILALIYGQQRPIVARGIGSLTLRAAVTGGKLRSASGQLSVPRFFHHREVFAQDLAVDFDITDSLLTIHQAQGSIAGGAVNVSGSLGWPIDEVNDSAGDLLFTIEQVDVGQLAMLLYPEVAEQFAGLISYRGRVRLGRSLTFLGAATTTNAIIYSFPLQSVRGSLQLDFNRSGGFQNLVASNLVGTAIGGQIAADVRLRGGSTFELHADGRLRRGKMEQLSTALGFERIVGSENFNASFQFRSRDATTLGALRGNLEIKFGEGDAQSIPVLADLNRLVPLMQLASTEITSGRMDARVGEGLLIIEDLLLNSEAFWIAGNGNASLKGGNLNLQGVLQTGGGIEAHVSQASVRRLATLLIPELVFVAELDNLLRNRTLYFRVRGSTKRPVIQPKIAPSLARGLVQEVKRSLLAAPRVMAISDP